jgi:hypothetical protein
MAFSHKLSQITHKLDKFFGGNSRGVLADWALADAKALSEAPILRFKGLTNPPLLRLSLPNEVSKGRVFC